MVWVSEKLGIIYLCLKGKNIYHGHQLSVCCRTVVNSVFGWSLKILEMIIMPSHNMWYTVSPKLVRVCAIACISVHLNRPNEQIILNNIISQGSHSDYTFPLQGKQKNEKKEKLAIQNSQLVYVRRDVLQYEL